MSNFNKIYKGGNQDKRRLKIENTAWDLLFPRVAEFLIIHSTEADYFIPFFLSHDEGFKQYKVCKTFIFGSNPNTAFLKKRRCHTLSDKIERKDIQPIYYTFCPKHPNCCYVEGCAAEWIHIPSTGEEYFSQCRCP